MKFGLACEGVTDQITLENILCGYFNDPDLDENIISLQPRLDATEQKQLGGGGWKILLKYLTLKGFRDAVFSHDFIIIQIDTDISEKPEFGISWTDELGHNLTTEKLIENVILKLIEIINQGKAEFYQAHAEKIIFAISVHSLECWLVAHYSEEQNKHDCFESLKTIINDSEKIKIRVAKKYKNYNVLSQPFLKRENIDLVAQKDISFKYFIQNLENIAL